MKAWCVSAVVLFFAFNVSAASHTDAFYVPYIEKAREFVRENPIVNKVEQTPRQVLIFWRRIDGLKNMLQLEWIGVLPENLRWQLNWRLNSHGYLRAIAFMQGDPQVYALASLVNLHTKVALAHLDARADNRIYAEVTFAVSNIGYPIFEAIAPKYAPAEFRKDQDSKAALRNWTTTK